MNWNSNFSSNTLSFYSKSFENISDGINGLGI